MIPRLLEAAGDRPVVVVGKGGVGKTTTAGALALSFADRGEPTHLLSLDPAHSLGDLFGQPVPSGEPVACECAADLRLEAFDATAALAGWLEGAREPLRELLDRGTYLDDEDIEDILGRALPGADEWMGARRLAALARREGLRLVVDTAPTGHALRLLEAGALLRGWETWLGALARKATVVASSFAGGPVRLASEDFLDDLAAERRAYERFLDRAAWVLTWRGEPAVRKESARLAGALRARGLRLAATVRVGSEGTGAPASRAAAAGALGASEGSGDGGAPAFAAPAGARAGCAALRAWGDGWRTAPHPAFGAGPKAAPRRTTAGRGSGQGARRERAAGAAKPSAAGLLLGGRERLLFVGKGGVGKTTCATACALALSASSSVLLVGVDPAGSIGDLLGRPVGRDGVRVGERLLVRQVEPEAELRAFRERSRSDVEAVAAGVGLAGGATLDREVLERFLELAPPGLDELAALALLAEADAEDVLVLDAAPTGHFFRFLEAPEVALGWIHALMRLVLKYREVVGLREPAERLLRLARRIRAFREALADPGRTGAVPVTLPEPMVVSETRRLCDGLVRAGVPLAGLIWNRTSAAEAVRMGAELSACRAAEAPVLAAPDQMPPPAGPGALRAFAGAWRRVA